MNNLSVEETIILLPALKRYQYPIWLYLFFSFIIGSFLWIAPNFLAMELPYHRNLSKKIRLADKYFYNKNYKASLPLYVEIINKYSEFKEARIKAVKSCFALSSEDVTFYFKGIDLLGDQKYKKSEISALSEFLPTGYHEYFKSLFESAKSE